MSSAGKRRPGHAASDPLGDKLIAAISSEPTAELRLRLALSRGELEMGTALVEADRALREDAAIGAEAEGYAALTDATDRARWLAVRLACDHEYQELLTKLYGLHVRIAAREAELANREEALEARAAISNERALDVRERELEVNARQVAVNERGMAQQEALQALAEEQERARARAEQGLDLTDFLSGPGSNRVGRG
jgi:hypothetical protein